MADRVSLLDTRKIEYWFCNVQCIAINDHAGKKNLLVHTEIKSKSESLH